MTGIELWLWHLIRRLLMAAAFRDLTVGATVATEAMQALAAAVETLSPATRAALWEHGR